MTVLARSLKLRTARQFEQFGQPNDSATNNGATGCTDTVLQFLTLLVRNIWRSHNQIRALAHHANRMTGLNYSEVGAYFRAMGLPYVVKLGLTADQMLSLSRTRGPVLIGEMYPYQPEWSGFNYQGHHADGRPNGYARPTGRAGRTQLSGFYGRHAALLLGYVDASHVYVFEPNHGSLARPEHPPYDVISVTQFRALVASYQRATGKTYAAYPTKALS